MMRACLLIALVGTLTEPAATQTKPDLSGTWKWLAHPAPPPPPAVPGRPAAPAPPPKTLSISITQSAGELKVQRELESTAKPATRTFTYRLDGAESLNRLGDSTWRTTARWKNSVLMLTSKVSRDGRLVETVTDVYRVENGDLIVETTRQSADGPVAITKETFRKGR